MMHVNLGQRGGALILSLFVVVLLVGAATSYHLSSHANYEGARREAAIIRARLAADEGIELAIAELKSGVDADGDGLGSLTMAGNDGRSAVVALTDLGGGALRIISRGSFENTTQSSEIGAQLMGGTSLPYDARAAIAARSPVTTLGHISVDGRDHTPDGDVVVGDGVFGISSVEWISNGGSSSVGGNGMAPTSPPPPAALEPLADWGDGIDQDGDGGTDEESWNGLDDDGDGEIDEDTGDFPVSPDVFFRLADGTLRAQAQLDGTYFASESDFTDYIAANDGNVPGGQVIFLDFDVWLPADFGPTLNESPSIIVHHRTSGDALMKNVHGAFKGVILGDSFTHLNGTFLLVGAMMSFSTDPAGNAFGNGGANVLFSSEVVQNLPGAGAGNTGRVRIVYWRRAANI